ncbi:MAG: hypothetical protein A2V70_06630 [Planctomycetes bacterium RBG_13_63_9]|nr:MAG: hypothetical protein A2V70_06630 [Planctomycetes bacterium RBG_13_63_9]
MSRVSQAVELFQQDCACSQAILATYGETLGLDRNRALRLATGFAGGMRMGETCGAVTGALMVLGLRHGGDHSGTRRGRDAVYAAVQQFTSRFQQRNGSVICKDLLGCDISTPEGMQTARQQNLFKTKCTRMVQDAAEILEDMAPGLPPRHD